MFYDAYVYDSMIMISMWNDELDYRTKSLRLNARPRFKGTLTEQVQDQGLKVPWQNKCKTKV
jgi:hypothetical protein